MSYPGLPAASAKCATQFRHPAGQAHEAPEILRTGITSVKSELTPAHPLQETDYDVSADKLDLAVLRNTQGLHAPLKLQMERRIVKQVGRLPCLPSCNLGLETLIGADETITFTDILNDRNDAEVMGFPHAMVEASLGLH